MPFAPQFAAVQAAEEDTGPDIGAEVELEAAGKEEVQ